MKILNAVILTSFLANVSFAQWPDTPQMNLAICSAGGEQAITKLAPRTDGSCYVSWFDNRAGGYDVYMQRLDASGNAMWQADGVLIADRNYSSTMDFDLDVDAFGNAVVVYRKNILGGDGVYATLISPAGVIQWSTQVQSAGPFVASPVVCAVDNDVVVGWISDDVSKFQRLNAKGVAQWGTPLSMIDPAGGTLQVADVHASVGGSVIASFVQYTTFWGTKHLKAQRIASDGTTVWASLTSVMSSNSLQIGAYPDFVSDGAGGGFFSWYGVGPLQVYAAHVQSDGSHGYGSEVQVASGGGTERVGPVGVFDGSEFVVFFRPQDNNQSSDGIAAQRLSATGTLLWGSAGVSLKTTSSSPQYGSFAAASTDQGAVLFFTQSTFFGNDVINGLSVDVNGNMQWSPNFVSVASTPSGKSRIVAESFGDRIVLAWQDDRSGNNDIYGQRVNSDGTLGNGAGCAADIDGDGLVGVTDLLAVVGTWGACPPIGDCLSDLNNDGVVNVMDLLAVIDQWGVC